MADEENPFRDMQIALCTSGEPLFECLYIGNIPARKDIRRTLFLALKPSTEVFGPIVRFKMPGPWHARRRHCAGCRGKMNDGNQSCLHAYVYFLRTDAPYAICKRAIEIAEKIPLFGFELDFAVDRPTSELYNDGEPIDVRVVANDLLVVPDHRQFVQTPLDEAATIFYDCPRCWVRVRFDNKAAHEQQCLGVVRESTRKLRKLSRGLSEAMKAPEQNNFLLLMAMLECRGCNKELWRLSAFDVIALKCNHFVCRSCFVVKKSHWLLLQVINMAP